MENILSGIIYTTRTTRKGTMLKQVYKTANVLKVETFQASIPDYQIIVLSPEHFNAIVYECPKREKQIYQNHLEVITSMSSFLGNVVGSLSARRGLTAKSSTAAVECAFVVT